MKTTTLGRKAETAVADFLNQKGYKILAQNWRTRWCEIDLIAQKYDIIYFIEVKYRSSGFQGSGFEHITPHKRRQLQFAVGSWSSQNEWGGDSRLVAAEVSGLGYDIINLVEID